MTNEPTPPAVDDPGPFYHGTKADLSPGDLLQPGYRSNFGERSTANYVYLAATLGAGQLGSGIGRGRPGPDLSSGAHRTHRG